jgi:hypothetical protein
MSSSVLGQPQLYRFPKPSIAPQIEKKLRAIIKITLRRLEILNSFSDIVIILKRPPNVNYLSSAG